MQRLLSVGIPTYNRSKSLSLMLSRLGGVVAEHADKVEIVVSDNCSSDDTQDVINEWVLLRPKNLRIKTVRHVENVGLSKNVVSLFYQATGKYLIILGDDDCLNPNVFGLILKQLEYKMPSAVIQGSWAGQLRGGKSGTISFKDAFGLFYEYGNAWAGIVDRQAAVHAIESRGLRGALENLVWPQTVFGFMAMFDNSSDKDIIVVDFEIGYPLLESLNITNKSYWIRSLTDLLKAGEIIQKYSKTKCVSKRFLKISSDGFIGHIRSILWAALLDGDKASTKEIQSLLASKFGLRGWLWAQILKIDNYPVSLRIIVSFAYFLKNPLRKKSLNMKIKQAKEIKNVEILNKENSGKRFGDWF